MTEQISKSEVNEGIDHLPGVESMELPGGTTIIARPEYLGFTAKVVMLGQGVSQDFLRLLAIETQVLDQRRETGEYIPMPETVWRDTGSL